MNELTAAEQHELAQLEREVQEAGTPQLLFVTTVLGTALGVLVQLVFTGQTAVAGFVGVLFLFGTVPLGLLGGAAWTAGSSPTTSANLQAVFWWLATLYGCSMAVGLFGLFALLARAI